VLRGSFAIPFANLLSLTFWGKRQNKAVGMAGASERELKRVDLPLIASVLGHDAGCIGDRV
jgi:hypothetical protein